MLPNWVHWIAMVAGGVLSLVSLLDLMPPPRVDVPNEKLLQAYRIHKQAIEQAGGIQRYKRKAYTNLAIGLLFIAYSAIRLHLL